MIGHETTPTGRRHLGYGVWRAEDDIDDSRALLFADARAWQAVLPSYASFTHLTGAALRGWWCPPLPEWLPTFVAQAWVQQQPMRPELRINRHRTPPAHDMIAGVRVASPGEILLACSRDLEPFDVLVLLAGALAAGEDLDEICACAARRRRGCRRLRMVLGQLPRCFESLWEVALWYFHEICDVPTVPQYDVRDESGLFIARADLRIQRTRVIHEYDGAHHLTRQQQRVDLRRCRDITNAGWLRRAYTNVDLVDGYERMLHDCDLTLGRPHNPRHLTAWEETLSGSLLTAAGRDRLRQRLALPRNIRRSA